MKLKFDANALCEVERIVGKRMVEIIEELESEAGASLVALRAFVAAGMHRARWASMPFGNLDLTSAGNEIDKVGTNAAADAVGKALAAYFKGQSE